MKYPHKRLRSPRRKFTLAQRISLIVSALKTLNVRISLDYSRYTYEFYWCGAFALVIVFFFKGRSTNDTIANTWNKAVAESISSNFAHIGTLKDPSLALEYEYLYDVIHELFRKVTFNEYHYYASGRQNCMYALFKIELKKRQCLFSTCTMELIWPRKDMVTIEVPVRVPDY